MTGFAAWEHPLAAAQLVAVMLAMGATLQPADFAAILARPRSFLWGVACQFALAPALAAATVRLAGLRDGAALGLGIVAAMPGGPMSTLFTHLGRGNAALAVALTATTTLLAPLASPAALRFVAGSEAVRLPWAPLAAQIGLYLFLPLAFGMLLVRRRPALRPALARWGLRIGGTLLAALVAGSLFAGRVRPLAHGWALPAAIVAFCVASQQLAMLPFRLFRGPPRDRLAVGIELTIRDLNLALLLKSALLPAAADADGLALFAILFYGGTSLAAAAVATAVFRRSGN